MRQEGPPMSNSAKEPLAQVGASRNRSRERRAELEAFAATAAANEPPHGNGREVRAGSEPGSEAASAEQGSAAAPLNNAPPRVPPSRKGGKRSKPAAAKGRNNGAAADHVDAVEREATIARLVAIEDDAEYDAQVTQEARRISVKVATISRRRKEKAPHQVGAAEVQTAIARMLALPPAEYVIRLKPEARSLGIAAGKLDELVETERKRLRAEAVAKERKAAGFGLSDKPPPGVIPKPAREPDANGVSWPDGFTMKKTGLWFQPPPDSKGDVPDPVWIAAPFQIRAETNDDANQSFGLLLVWRDPNDIEHQWAMPLRMVHADGNPIAVELQDAGLSCGTSRKAHDGLKHFLGAVHATNRVRCVERAGWHGNAFVLPNGRIFGANEASGGLVLQSEHAATASAYVARGTLAQWKEHIADPAGGNDLFVFTMSASFTGPLLEVTGETSGGVHVYGGSQTGKTTLMCTAASVWGPGDNKTGPMRSWRVTANGLEAVAAEHSDGMLILDEIGQASGREVGDVVYMLANQRGKARMGRAGGARPLMTWRLVYLSTGETTLATKMNEAGQRTYAGQEVRLLNLSADVGAGLGVFQNLHGAVSGGAFADQLRRAAVACCGTAGPAFLEALVRDRTNDPEKLERSLRQGREKFLVANVPEAADGQVRSAATRFALIGMAGELARTYGVVPWPTGEAWRAAAACFQSWLTGRGGAGAAEDRQAHSVVAAFIALHGSARFERLGKGEYEEPPAEQRITNRAGYVRTAGEGQEFLILAPVWNDEVCRGLDPSRVARTLRDAGLLVPESSYRLAQRVHIQGRGRQRVYVIRGEILGEEPGAGNGGFRGTSGTNE
jgi:uncharacterized protein (DUF927 family)